jgi:hypothetical protein
MDENTFSFYKPEDYHLIGKLVKIRHPGMLIINEHSYYDKEKNHEETAQIFDLGGKNVYLLVGVNVWKPRDNKTDCFVMARLLLGSNIYVWRGVKASVHVVNDLLDERLEPV